MLCPGSDSVIFPIPNRCGRHKILFMLNACCTRASLGPTTVRRFQETSRPRLAWQASQHFWQPGPGSTVTPLDPSARTPTAPNPSPSLANVRPILVPSTLYVDGSPGVPDEKHMDVFTWDDVIQRPGVQVRLEAVRHLLGKHLLET